MFAGIGGMFSASRGLVVAVPSGTAAVVAAAAASGLKIHICCYLRKLGVLDKTNSMFHYYEYYDGYD